MGIIVYFVVLVKLDGKRGSQLWLKILFIDRRKVPKKIPLSWEDVKKKNKKMLKPSSFERAFLKIPLQTQENCVRDYL